MPRGQEKEMDIQEKAKKGTFRHKAYLHILKNAIKMRSVSSSEIFSRNIHLATRSYTYEWNI